jgi:glutathione S-transferase
MIKLYGVPRSRAMRPLWMLEELGLPYELVRTDFATGATRTPEYLRVNPNGHIPALQDGDLTLWESMAINLYLARRYDGGLWPKTVADEGRAFQWSLWAMTELEEPVLTTLLHRRLFPEAQRDARKADEAAARFRQPLGVLDGALAGRGYLLGEDFTVADLNVASVLAWAPLAGLDLGSAPAAQAWLGRCVGRPAFARVRG